MNPDPDGRRPGADLAPKDERKFSVGLELGTGALLPGGKLSITYERLWEGRVRQLLTEASEYAGVGEDMLADHAAENRRFADLFAAAGRKAISAHDGMLRDWLARLVAAAFADDAKIDGLSFMVDLLAQLEPVHLRLLRAVGRLSLQEGGSFSAGRLEEQVPADAGVVSAALQRLGSLGLLDDDRGRGGPMAFGGTPAGQGFSLTQIGRELLKRCEEAAAEL
jgi:hypothetical protein